MLDRKTGPPIHNIQHITVPPTDIYQYDNGVRVCEINMGSQDILKIEIVHVAGRSVEDVPLIGRAVSSLLKEGCGGKSSAQIAEEIDFHGASIKTASNMDFSYTTIYTLNKHADKIIHLLHEMYFAPDFPEDEIKKFKNLNIQKLKEQLSKNDVITYRTITEEIFGKDHPYGYNSLEADYKNITRKDLTDHFNNYYGSDNCYILISGKINDETRRLMSSHFGQTIKASKDHPYQESSSEILRKKLTITTKNEHQSAIKLGRKLFNKNHPDHPHFFLLNTVFGGYFGSRLMSSIREDHGYTYDISSSMDMMLHDGCFYISTDTATEYVQPIISEVYHQMNILKEEKIKEKELNMVKNYLMGNFLNYLDGPMNLSSFAKNMILTGQHPSEFSKFADILQQTRPEDLLEMAQKYFLEDTMIEVVVSPPKSSN
ncbi:MAG: pitrilysin family protein [Saprospiraceae bacterium]